MPELEFRLLGPLEVVAGGAALPLAAGKPRALLTALLLRPNRPVSRDALLEALWPGKRPASAAHALEVHVSRTRKALDAAGAGERLRTADGAYLLEVRPGELDLECFEQLIREGRDALAHGDPASAVGSLAEALALWRDDPLPELADEPLARIEAERLRGLRLEAIEGRLEALLALGEHAAALAELQAVVDAHPLRERPRAQLMLALYRSGRQAEALDAYQQARRTLVDELGLDPSEELRNLEQAILRQDPGLAAPTPTPSRRQRTNLPRPATPLIGRDRELEEAGTLVRSHRLTTLTGPGGTGKTRLALQLAAEATDHFPDGVFWVPLQALRDPALVEHAIEASVGAVNGLIEYVGDRKLLLLLDNFEHVAEAAPVVSSLLAGTPNATVLVTSREPLHIRSEQLYPVEPLRDDDGVALFVERARAVAPAFEPTAAVGEICRRVDGLPLAIELAAGRVGLLDLDELLARLERRLPLLASRSRDAPARQRTLRATIGWSYELLPADEQDLFRNLAVFRGSFSLDAAHAVCDADLDTLESLVVKNLVRRWGSGRLGMLDTIGEYALERLHESDEAENLRRRHAEFFLAVLQDANLNAGTEFDAGKPLRHDVAAAEQDNLRGALAWAVRSGSVALGLDLARAADWFWVMHDPNEGMRWFERLLEHPEAETVAPAVRADALRSYGASAYLSGRPDVTERLCEASLELYDQLGDEPGRAVLLHRLAICAMARRDLDRARRLLEESHAIRERSEESVTRAFRLGETTGTLGAIARDAGEHERAYALISESAAVARQAGVVWWEGGMLAELAALSLNATRIEDAELHARGSLAIADRLHDRPGCVFGVGLLACVAAERGQAERAGRLWGAIEDKVAGAPLGGWQRHRETCERRIRELAGPEFERGRAEGRALALDDAVSMALE